ncbi:Leukotriene A-4 hydrolase-like protein [Hibiscus syriacus]|uniref:Leukotriene A-4 hydrolase-like protein n=1 Tax=Hibiscus syriacus TaxID=106335 RepID=A0A6A2YDN9_HIBSY|nr:Leukotriene A-4 hydrolase-like protein [Hibiscus syriacus]
MSASHVERRPPVADEGYSHILPQGFNSLWSSETRVVEQFHMNQPIPPYLFAFAVGELGTEEMIMQGEKLFGNYPWERFDLLVLPPSFPYGGMENLRMVFLTPTVIKGDATGAQVVAHELAHSWTGNLITNRNNEHFWLNEGFTTYAERRIVKAVLGEDKAEGVDPDAIYSEIPYEKGFQFLWRIERQIGRPTFDAFILDYIDEFKFQSIDTKTFLDFLKFKVPGIEEDIDLVLWTEGTDEVADWKGQEWELYLENLPRVLEPSLVLALDERYRLADSKDYEVKVAFLQLAILSKCKKKIYGEVDKTLKEVGRMKYLRPLYTALVQGDGKEEERSLAKRVFSEARECYHPIARGVVESILAKQ